MMRTSSTGFAAIKIFEGLRLEAYLDRFAGVWTIGWGRTGDDVYPGKRITEREAEEMLKQDVIEAERAIRHSVLIQLRQREFDALVSLVYNLGPVDVLDPKRSTLKRKLDAGDRWGAAGEFTRWNKSGGETVEGLVLRRWREAGMFMGVWEPGA